ncbi:MAG: glutamine--fructose-6-phosphate transaminase (isomerizing) [Candidatus Babeliales bacterium]|nr:glutamine--fructose-6-phosphate transaminase (isomerizing) [Candidatus Babeliales bacterium]
MCGVVGYIGKSYCRDYIIQGLSRLEYRGYDSSGIACIEPKDKKLVFLKSEGRLQNLIEKFNDFPINGFAGIGHTRWSTHGIVSQQNAHPQFDCQKTISIVHNGIIENHNDLRLKLESAGHIFNSTTDTEVIAHFLEDLLVLHKALMPALISLIKCLEGAYAFACLLQDFSDQIIVVRKRSPLCIGVGQDEMFIASDLLAFSGRTNKVLFLPDESFAIITKDLIQLFDFNGNALPIDIKEVITDSTLSQMGAYESYMLKEIYEQKSVINKCVTSFKASNIWDNLGVTPEFIKNLDTINLIACGTSWHAAKIAQFFFEKICLIPTRVFLASEFRYMPFFPETKSLYLAISQSGETADTLEALALVKSMGCASAVITNVASSSMVRQADGFLLTHAGPEIAVASTKSFTAQLTALYWLCNKMALEKSIITQKEMIASEEDLRLAAEILENCIENYKIKIITDLAIKYASYKHFIFLGRHISYPFALEAALKLKEISYIFSQCYAAGELKHGPIALIDSQTPVILFSCFDSVIYQKLVSNAQEVKSRNGHLIVFAFEGQTELIKLADTVFVIPQINPLLAPIAMTGLMQFFVYQIAKVLGRPIDRPRNLAKSVTVE